MTRECKDCSADISDRHFMARYCHQCADARKPKPKPRKQRDCIECGRDITNDAWNAKRCKPCRYLIATGQRNGMTPQAASARIVTVAVQGGILPNLNHIKTKCCDCNDRATCYDHRDYMKPLDVDPVCNRCNINRGHGINALNMRYCEERDREAVAVFGRVK